jgi:hypothetical protein
MITHGRSGGPGFVSPGVYDAIDWSAREHAAQAARRTEGWRARDKSPAGWRSTRASPTRGVTEWRRPQRHRDTQPHRDLQGPPSERRRTGDSLRHVSDPHGPGLLSPEQEREAMAKKSAMTSPRSKKTGQPPQEVTGPPACAGARKRPRLPFERTRLCSSRHRTPGRAGPRRSRSSGSASAFRLRPSRDRPGPQLRQLVAQVPGLRQ